MDHLISQPAEANNKPLLFLRPIVHSYEVLDSYAQLDLSVRLTDLNNVSNGRKGTKSALTL